MVELQIRTQKFLDLLRDRINGQRLPSRTIEFFAYPELSGKPLQRIECVGCTLAPGSETLNVNVDIIIHYSASYVSIQSAGSLQAPVTEQLRRTIPISLSITLVPLMGPGNLQLRQPVLRWSFLYGIFPGGVVPLDLPSTLDLRVAGLVASDSVVAIRLGTREDDFVLGPIVDRLSDSDWAQLTYGQIFADELARSLEVVVQGALSDEIQPGKAVSGAWFTAGIGPPFAGASATLIAVGACVVDVPIDVQLTALIVPSGHSLSTTVVVRWNPDSTFCDIAAALLLTPIGFVVVNDMIEDKVTETIWGHADPPNEFHEVARDDESITFERKGFIDMPSSQFILTHSEVNDDGLLVRGTLTLQSTVRNLQGSASPPASTLHEDCGSRSVGVKFVHGKVVLFDLGLDGDSPRLFTGGAVFLPQSNAWQVKVEPSSFWRELTVSFLDPPTGRLPPGTVTSVFLHTDCGTRWVDLGVIPQDRPPPATGDIARMLSRCMALSDPWGMGIMNLEWLVDPPELLLGIDPLRLWAFTARDLPEFSRLEFVAVGPEGRTRSLGVVEQQRHVAAQFATHANETLQVHTGHGFSAPAPVVRQRWIMPFAKIPVGQEPVSVSVRGGMIAIVDTHGKGQIVDLGPDGQVRARRVDERLRAEPAIGRVWNNVTSARNQRSHGTDWAAPIQIDTRTVAVVHEQMLVIGLAEPARRM
jgi:hypothetical protein